MSSPLLALTASLRFDGAIQHWCSTCAELVPYLGLVVATAPGTALGIALGIVLGYSTAYSTGVQHCVQH